MLEMVKREDAKSGLFKEGWFEYDCKNRADGLEFLEYLRTQYQ